MAKAKSKSKSKSKPKTVDLVKLEKLVKRLTKLSNNAFLGEIYEDLEDLRNKAEEVITNATDLKHIVKCLSNKFGSPLDDCDDDENADEDLE